jgi:hypothetical protein
MMAENVFRFRSRAGRATRFIKRALTGLVLVASSHGFAAAAPQATPEQRKACTPDVYRLCAGEIPNAAAITACLRRHKAGLSDACRAVFEQ